MIVVQLMISTCRLCGQGYMHEPGTPCDPSPVARDRETGEPVWLCPGCEEMVQFVLRDYRDSP